MELKEREIRPITIDAGVSIVVMVIGSLNAYLTLSLAS